MTVARTVNEVNKFHDISTAYCLFCVIPGVPAVFVAVWAIVRATLADAR